MNEPEFVRYLKQAFPFDSGTGIGDDASVVNVDPALGLQLITKDILVEGVHFSLDYMTLEQLALKSLAVNLSDIAAMGGTPQYFYLGLAFPKRLPQQRALDFFKGLNTGCERWHVQLAGGDFSASSLMMISITVIGAAPAPVFRHNARPGDLIGITGKTGESAAGLRCLLAGETEKGPAEYFIQRHIHVNPEIETGRLLAPYVNAMIDVSDGVILDLGRILTASGNDAAAGALGGTLGARLEFQHFPVDPALRTLCRDKGWDEYELALAGGEDYVLLFTVSRDKEALLKKQPVSYAIIGEITADGELAVEHNGKPVKIVGAGYDHFEKQ